MFGPSCSVCCSFVVLIRQDGWSPYKDLTTRVKRRRYTNTGVRGGGRGSGYSNDLSVINVGGQVNKWV